MKSLRTVGAIALIILLSPVGAARADELAVPTESIPPAAAAETVEPAEPAEAVPDAAPPPGEKSASAPTITAEPAEPVEEPKRIASPSPAPLADPPVVNADEYTTTVGTDLVIAAPGPLGNDTGGPFTYWGIIAPTNGDITYSDDAGAFTYRPNPDFVGDDTFTYFAFIGSTAYGPATVTIHVVPPPNGAPVATDEVYVAHPGVMLYVAPPGFLDNDSDPDGDGFTGQSVLPFSHAQSYSFSPDGELTYLAEDGFTGSDVLTYVAKDSHGALSNIASITVLVTNPAAILEDDEYTMAQGTTLTVDAPGLLANDLVPAGWAVAPCGPATTGNVLCQGDGSLTYTPPADFSGDVTFPYEVSAPVPVAAARAAVMPLALGQAMVTVHVTASPSTAGDDPATADGTAELPDTGAAAPWWLAALGGTLAGAGMLVLRRARS